MSGSRTPRRCSCTKQQIETATWTNPGMRQFRAEIATTGIDPESDPSMAQDIAADVPDLVRVFRDILERAKQRPILDVDEDAVTVGQMIEFIRRRLTMEDKPIALRMLLRNSRSERAVIAMFLCPARTGAFCRRYCYARIAISVTFLSRSMPSSSRCANDALQARDDWR